MADRSPLDDDQRALVEGAARPLRALAHEVARGYETVDTDELAQVGVEAACQVAPTYDPSRGATFLTFAYRRAFGEMVDHANKEERHRQLARAMMRGVLAMSEALELGDPLCEDLSTRVARFDDGLAATAAAGALGLFTRLEPEIDPESRLLIEEERTRVSRVARPYLDGLDHATRSLISGTVIEERPLTEVARGLGFEYQDARYRLTKALAGLGRALNKA